MSGTVRFLRSLGDGLQAMQEKEGIFSPSGGPNCLKSPQTALKLMIFGSCHHQHGSTAAPHAPNSSFTACGDLRECMEKCQPKPQSLGTKNKIRKRVFLKFSVFWFFSKNADFDEKNLVAIDQFFVARNKKLQAAARYACGGTCKFLWSRLKK